MIFIAYAYICDRKNARFIRKLENYPSGAEAFWNSEYMEYNDGYTIGIESFFGWKQNVICYAEKENASFRIRLIINENMWGSERYSIEYQSLPALVYEDESYEYYRNTYEMRGKFYINADGGIIQSCGGRILGNDEITQAETIININSETINELKEIANEYWSTAFAISS